MNIFKVYRKTFGVLRVGQAKAYRLSWLPLNNPESLEKQVPDALGRGLPKNDFTCGRIATISLYLICGSGSPRTVVLGPQDFTTHWDNTLLMQQLFQGVGIYGTGS